MFDANIEFLCKKIGSEFGALSRVFLFCFFFLSRFLSRTFTIHRTAGEEAGYFFNISLPLSSASQTLGQQSSDYCRELTFAHRQQPDSNRQPLVSECKSLTFISLSKKGRHQLCPLFIPVILLSTHLNILQQEMQQFVNHLHEKALHLVYIDQTSTLKGLCQLIIHDQRFAIQRCTIHA